MLKLGEAGEGWGVQAVGIGAFRNVSGKDPAERQKMIMKKEGYGGWCETSEKEGGHGTQSSAGGILVRQGSSLSDNG